MDIGFIEEKKSVVSTTIPQSIYRDIKQKRWRFSDLLILGYRSKMENAPEKFKEYDTKLEKMSKRLSYYIGQLEERQNVV